MRLRSLLWAVALVALAPLPAKADLITVYFDGIIQQCDQLSPCDPSIGGLLNGSYVYDSTEPGFPIGEYTAYIAVRSFAFSAGSRFFSGNTGLIQVGSRVQGCCGPLEDIYGVTLPAAPGYVLGMFLYRDFPEPAVPPHEPLIRPELDDFAGGAGAFANHGINLSRFTTVVPEPSTWLMLSMGLSLVGIAARRRRRTAFSDHR